MDEKFQKLKKIVGTVLKKFSKPFIIVAIIVIIVLVLIAGIQYIITLNDAVYNDKDKKNVPYAVEQYTGDVTIGADGNILTGKTAKELWDEMIKNGSRVKEYLDGPDELLKLMNAEMVTNYLDTRSNPDKPIDWKKINKDINSNKVQGIIKLKRAYDNGTISNITYVDPETFQSYIDEYNETGSEEAKKKALSHFTLEKGYNNSSNFGMGQAISEGTTINIPSGLGAVHTYMGWQMITDKSSMQYKLREQAGMNFDSEGFGRINGRYVIACTTTFGQVGDYIDFYQEDGTVIQCIIGDIKNQNDAGCNEWGHLNGTCIIEFVVDKATWYNCGHPNPGQQGFHMEWNKNLIKAINGGSYFDNPTFGNSTIQGNGTTVGTTKSLDKMLFIGDSITEGLRQAHTSNYWLTAENIKLLENTMYKSKESTQPRYWLNNFNTLPETSEVNSVCVLLGVNDPTSQSQMKQLIDKLEQKYSGKNIYIQKVFPVGKGSSGFVYTPEKMNSLIKTYNDDIEQYCNQKPNVHFIDTTQGYVTSDGYLERSKTADGVHLTDYNTWVKNIAERVTGTSGTSEGNTIGGELMKWPTDGTNISSYFGYRNAPTAGASTNHGGIDIAVPTGTNIYATEAGTVVTAGNCGSAGNMVAIDHGNGYITKYMHNSVIKVSVGEKVTKGQIIALAGSTGVSTGSHLHFQIEYNGDKIDPLTFKYDNGMGDGTGGIGSNSSSLSTNNKIYAKVATWNEVTDTVESNDPSVQSYSTTRYNMTTTKIDYQQLVSGYKMPFDYLWDLLVLGQEKKFVFDLSELIYGSQIEITVHDNLTKNTNVSVDTYTKKTKTVTSDVKVNVKYTDTSTSYDNWDTEHKYPHTSTKTGTATETGGPFEKESQVSYKTTHTVITKTNTLDTKLTKANVWIVNYSQEFTYTTPNVTVTNSSVPYNDEEYPETPNKTDSNDSAGLAEEFRKSVQSKYESQHTSAVATVESLKSEYYNKTVNRNVNIKNTVESKKYVSSPAKIVEKTDKQSKEPNFVTLYLKYRKVQNNIESAADWLFEILEKGKNTKDMVDLTKYLLYKANGHNYGVKEYDFNVYDPANFQSFSDQYGGVSNIDGIPGQIYDFLLSKGVPPVGAAAILGNIEGESGFNPSVVNSIGCSGLCQWYQGRLEKLKSLANSKGTSWTDVQTQLEHMWNELEGSYSGVKNVIMSATDESNMEYATWYWGRYYEVFFVGNNYESTKHYTAKRYECAKKWYQQWKSKHTGSYSGNVQPGEAARIQGTEARIAWLYDGNGIPTSKAENDRYLETFPVEYLDRSGNRQSMNVTMHKKLKTEIQAIFKEMAQAGFKIIGGNISYRTWGSDAGFKGRFPQSAHTYGHAFDVNPNENYCIYANGTRVGSYYRPGSDPYSVTEPIINIWKQHGFYWGGDWHSLKDYMHFSYFDH